MAGIVTDYYAPCCCGGADYGEENREAYWHAAGGDTDPDGTATITRSELDAVYLTDQSGSPETRLGGLISGYPYAEAIFGPYVYQLGESLTYGYLYYPIDPDGTPPDNTTAHKVGYATATKGTFRLTTEDPIDRIAMRVREVTTKIYGEYGSNSSLEEEEISSAERTVVVSFSQDPDDTTRRVSAEIEASGTPDTPSADWANQPSEFYDYSVTFKIELVFLRVEAIILLS